MDIKEEMHKALCGKDHENAKTEVLREVPMTDEQKQMWQELRDTENELKELALRGLELHKATKMKAKRFWTNVEVALDYFNDDQADQLEVNEETMAIKVLHEIEEPKAE